jgi:hypothetical protein
MSTTRCRISACPTSSRCSRASHQCSRRVAALSSRSPVTAMIETPRGDRDDGSDGVAVGCDERVVTPGHHCLRVSRETSLISRVIVHPRTETRTPPARRSQGLAPQGSRCDVAPVRYPAIPMVFGETRTLAEDWTYRYLAAARTWAETDRPRCTGSASPPSIPPNRSSTRTPQRHRRRRRSAPGPGPTGSPSPTADGSAPRSTRPGATPTHADKRRPCSLVTRR